MLQRGESVVWLRGTDPYGSIKGIADEEDFTRPAVGVHDDIAGLATIDCVPELVDRTGCRRHVLDQHIREEISARLAGAKKGNQRVVRQSACRAIVRAWQDLGDIEN